MAEGNFIDFTFILKSMFVIKENASLNKLDYKKSFPAQVFLNHFEAICHHIKNDENAFDLNKVKYFKSNLFSKPGIDLERIKRVLYNSWSTEHALHIAGKVNDSEYYRFALHWSFPQAYYSCYLNMHAFCLATGDLRDSHRDIILGFGDRVKRKVYPECISFYADGNYQKYSFHNLPLYEKRNSALSLIKSSNDAQSQIGSFLKSTRSNKAQYHKDKRQKSANPIKTNTNKVAVNFTPFQWQQIIDNIGPTSLFDILYRLRIKANYNDIESFMNADIDFEKFHHCLIHVVGYLNFVHEAYLAKALGPKKYAALLNGFPAHLRDSFIRTRYEDRIIPSIQDAA